MRIYYALLLLVLVSCKHTEQTATVATGPKNSGNDIASEEARIIAHIVSIDETRDTEGVCSKAPCRAQVKIESIIKKGSLFHLQDLEKPVPVFFAFTLAPTTEDLFPGIKTNYPGLQINDKFEATIQNRPAMNETGFAYTIYDYKKLNTNTSKPFHLEK